MEDNKCQQPASFMQAQGFMGSDTTKSQRGMEVQRALEPPPMLSCTSTSAGADKNACNLNKVKSIDIEHSRNRPKTTVCHK